jgi:hypothetical protein
VSSLFLSSHVEKFGCYAVKLYVTGQPTEVVIDDSFPFDETPEHDDWAFAKSVSDNGVYIQVLEKAFAKVFGSYEAMQCGKPY